MEQPPALIIAGPTASGKSALALALARERGGTVVNADSMQAYRELRILTARPTTEEESAVPHRLYGTRPAAEAASVAGWRADAVTAMEEATRAGRLPILCGGSGLYLRALTHGLSDIPPIPGGVRAEARALLAREGPATLHARLTAADAETAAMLRPSDPQRLARAWEVLIATGRGLAAWRKAAPATGAAPYAFSAILLDPPRDELRAAIAARWDAMIAEGAGDEVRALLALGLDPALPAMRAHGVPEVAAVLRGVSTAAEARRKATLAIGRYTKRQATWFRHHQLAPTGRAHTIHARITGQTQLSEIITNEVMRILPKNR